MFRLLLLSPAPLPGTAKPKNWQLASHSSKEGTLVSLKLTQQKPQRNSIRCPVFLEGWFFYQLCQSITGVSFKKREGRCLVWLKKLSQNSSLLFLTEMCCKVAWWISSYKSADLSASICLLSNDRRVSCSIPLNIATETDHHLPLRFPGSSRRGVSIVW